MFLFDTHAHLDDAQFAGQHDALLARAAAAGVASILCVGTTAASSEVCVELASRFHAVSAAVGIQPNYCADAKPADWRQLVVLAGRAKVAAIGETGLDGYWDHAPLALQQDYFDRHLRLAQQLQRPVVIHMRDAQRELTAMLQEARRRGPLAGIMHAFTGDAALAAWCVDLGLHISFAGMVTYKKSAALRQVAAGVPEDRLLMETDSPYLSPHPCRGQRPNEPALLLHTAQCLAEARSVSLEQLAAQTTANAMRLFQLAGPGVSL